MPKITKIETQRNKSRVNIFVDDSFFCGLNKETAVIFGLKEGKEIDEEKLKHALFESDVKSAFEKSLDILGRRMNSRKELNDKLIQKGYTIDVAQEAIKKLEDYHYIDDKLFAKQFVQSNPSLSKKVLNGKLVLKGISSDIILEIIEDIADESEFELCKKQARKYLKSKSVSSFQDKQKLQASLARKGFSFDMIKHVCNELKVGLDDD